MKGIISAAIFCSLLATVCVASPMSVSAQQVVDVPEFGCGEVSHYLDQYGERRWFRTYVCDHLEGKIEL